MRQVSRTEETPGPQISRADGAGQSESMSGTEREQKKARLWNTEDEQRKAQAEKEERGTEQMSGAGNSRKEDWLQTEDPFCTEQANGTSEGLREEQKQHTSEEAWSEQGQQAFRTVSGQAPSPALQANDESPEDSAAVTEEELEALLKEFLTT